MSIEKLRVLCETTFADYPDASVEQFVRDAVEEYDKLQESHDSLLNKDNKLENA